MHFKNVMLENVYLALRFTPAHSGWLTLGSLLQIFLGCSFTSRPFPGRSFHEEFQRYQSIVVYYGQPTLDFSRPLLPKLPLSRSSPFVKDFKDISPQQPTLIKLIKISLGRYFPGLPCPGCLFCDRFQIYYACICHYT